MQITLESITQLYEKGNCCFDIDILKASRSRNSDRKIIQLIKIGSGWYENKTGEQF